ncbi:MAG: hypothetical protein ACREIL_02845 [Nitrospiraceae bacterium]
MRPSPHRMPLPIPRLAWLLGLILLAGLASCGPPSSDQAPGLDSRAATSTRTDVAAPEQTRPAPRPTSGRSPDALPAPTKPGLLLTESSRGIPPASDARAPSTTASSDRHPREERAAADLAQAEAWAQWYAAAREHPDVGVRLQALEQWAQQPGEALDPVTYALVDGDEDVRGRAQDLWAQQLTREEAAAWPVPEEGDRGQTAR